MSIETFEMLIDKVELYKVRLKDLNIGEKVEAEEVFSSIKSRFVN